MTDEQRVEYLAAKLRKLDKAIHEHFPDRVSELWGNDVVDMTIQLLSEAKEWRGALLVMAETPWKQNPAAISIAMQTIAQVALRGGKAPTPARTGGEE
jgi:hypothetical protein